MSEEKDADVFNRLLKEHGQEWLKQQLKELLPGALPKVSPKSEAWLGAGPPPQEAKSFLEKMGEQLIQAMLEGRLRLASAKGITDSFEATTTVVPESEPEPEKPPETPLKKGLWR